MPIEFVDSKILKKTVQLGIRYAPFIDIEADRDKLAEFAKHVRTTDRRTFNTYSFNKTAPNGMQSALLFERDVRLQGLGQMHHCPLVVFPDFAEIALIYKVAEAPNLEIDGRDRPRDEDFDTLMKSIMRQFFEKIDHVDVNRIGKVYDYIWGPFEEDAAEWLAQKFVRAPNNLPLTGGNVHFLSRIDSMNVNLQISSGMAPNGFVIQTRLDINNADNTQRIEHSNLNQILEFATRFHRERLRNLLAGE